MAAAPEPYLSALVRVLDRAILYCRNQNWADGFPHEHTADLMDAIHNIPTAIQDWQPWHANLIWQWMLNYESKWASKGGMDLCQIYDDIVAGREFTPGQ